MTIYKRSVIVMLSEMKKGETKVKRVSAQVEDYLYDFYRKVGQQAGGLPVEKVMSDALFKLAGELSLNALGKQKRTECR